MAEVETTRQVDKVVLRDDVLKNVLHAELYKTLREMLSKRYAEMEKSYFEKLWIKFKVNNEIGYWNGKAQIAIPVQNKYASINNSYFGLLTMALSEKQTKFLLVFYHCC